MRSRVRSSDVLSFVVVGVQQEWMLLGEEVGMTNLRPTENDVEVLARVLRKTKSEALVVVRDNVRSLH